LDRNKARDDENQAKLKDMGWKILVVWECQLKDEKKLREIIRRFLGD
jgi:DNA mismatch endonuclease, patch repair protein